jgi:hypothetical protein
MESSSFIRMLVCVMLCVSLPIPGYSSSQDEVQAILNIDVEFDPRFLQIVDAELLCSSGALKEQRFQMENASTKLLELEQFQNAETTCQLRVSPPLGYSAVYSARSERVSRANKNGCQYARISDGDSIHCRIEVVQDRVKLSAYKKWIGGTGAEGDVRISLECESGAFSGYRYINEASPDGWDISDIDPAGVTCSVHETPGDTFVIDESDCQNLVIFPGRGEECTMVNTKIVKRIEMLNRYGKAIMIVVMLAAGLIAVRRYV